MLRACKQLACLWVAPVLVLIWLRGQSLLIIQRLTVDLPALAGLPGWAGLLSHVGGGLWLSCASVLIFNARVRRWLWLPGLLSLILGLDDGLMLHEELLPQVLRMDHRVVQPALYALYAGLLGLTLRRLRPWMREPGFLVLLAACLCLGASVSLDMAVESNLLPTRHPLLLDEGFAMWLEDGLKLLGIVAWWGYWTSFCTRCTDS